MTVSVTVRAGRFKRLKIDFSDETFSQIQRLAKKYGFRTDEALKILLLGDFLDENVNEKGLEHLEARLEDLERELYELEGKWSPLKFKTYYLAMDNQNLAIQISAMIAQNKRLRERLGKPRPDYSKIESLIHYYLQFSGKT